ncbi:DNA phosphorothioation-associated protein 4 [Embleya scabrispora]|uniref:DNA phosphorothioation-associated protein 4 n=1 Tax=Embleya scabrispora TaxID=159449 RepID=UPI0003608EA9|nr:DNA phosphorothioation-associated protein 4 [Embleya scabrispora]
MAEDRFRRPADHEDLLTAMTTKDGPFTTLYEAMMFAATLGARKGVPTPFTRTDEPINLSRLGNRTHGEILVDLLAAARVTDDPKILADDRLQDRVRIFEEYANTGLNFIRGELNASGRDISDVVNNLVLDALAETPDTKPDVVSEILDVGKLVWE